LFENAFPLFGVWPFWWLIVSGIVGGISVTSLRDNVGEYYADLVGLSAAIIVMFLYWGVFVLLRSGNIAPVILFLILGMIIGAIIMALIRSGGYPMVGNDFSQPNSNQNQQVRQMPVNQNFNQAQDRQFNDFGIRGVGAGPERDLHVGGNQPNQREQKQGRPVPFNPRRRR